LDLHGLGQQRARALPQDFGELIVKASWLNKFGNVIVGHGISLLQWRSGGVKHPHDMPPFRFAPSPTFSDSSFLPDEMWYPPLRSEGVQNAGMSPGRTDCTSSGRRMMFTST